MNGYQKLINTNIIENPASISAESKWLVIGIPTVGRKNNEDYLLTSLATIAEQLPIDSSDLLYHKILLVIVNMQGVGHTRFEEAKTIYTSIANPKSPYFFFIDASTETLEDPKYPKGSGSLSSQHDLGNANVPGYAVRKQTRDIVVVMRKCMHKSKYYLFLEDDMKFCPHGLFVIQVAREIWCSE